MSFTLLSSLHSTPSHFPTLLNTVNSICAQLLLQQDGNVVSLALWRTGEASAQLLEVYATVEAFNKVAEARAPLDAVLRRSVRLGARHSAVDRAVRPVNITDGFVLHAQPAFSAALSSAAGDADDAVPRDCYPVLVQVASGQASDGAFAAALQQLLALFPSDQPSGLLTCVVLRDGFGAIPAINAGVGKAQESCEAIGARDEDVVSLVFASSASAMRAAPAIAALASCGGDALSGSVQLVADGVQQLHAVRSALDAALAPNACRLYDAIGYVVHPSLCTGDVDIAASAVASTPSLSTDAVCHPRMSSDNTPRSFVFRPVNDDGFALRVDDEQRLVIPLRALLRKLLGREAARDEIAAASVFPQLGRLRALRDDIAVLDQFLQRGAPLESVGGAVRHRVECVLANLDAFGFALPDKARGCVAEQLGAFVAIVERAFEARVGAAQQLLRSDGAVEYLSLLEVYHVNDIVTAAASPLGGTQVAYRVCDVYYSTVRSAFGGKKLSLHLALECLATLGDTLAFVSFEEVLGDWEGAQRVANLPYRVLHHDAADDKRLLESMRTRGAQLLALGHEPQYRSYHEQCFFGHGTMGKGTAASKLASLSKRKTESKDNKSEGTGRLVVDTLRGMALGHNVAPGHDNMSLAVQAAVKAYRSVQRARNGGDAGSDVEERVKAAGLRLVDAGQVSEELAHCVWPAVVAFSLGLKRWGHVLVNGLAPVEPSSDAWDRLVLPKSKKELLISLVQAAFDPNAPRLRDLVHNKGSGSLFLLHGVPGTGKTLTVEALAERYAVPCYYLTFGELGTSVKELEATMGDVLALCSGWGALVLLDEGDALVERREKGALLLNSMVGVLLKSLDAFEGLLFITTNRVASFDPAALSRVTLSIRYGSLKASGRRKVWRNVLERAAVTDATQFDVHALARRGGSGRDINAAVRLALTLAYYRQQPLSQAILLEVLDIADDFKKDFGGGAAPHADGGRISDDDDDDDSGAN